MSLPALGSPLALASLVLGLPLVSQAADDYTPQRGLAILKAWKSNKPTTRGLSQLHHKRNLSAALRHQIVTVWYSTSGHDAYGHTEQGPEDLHRTSEPPRAPLLAAANDKTLEIRFFCSMRSRLRSARRRSADGDKHPLLCCPLARPAGAAGGALL